MGVLFRRGIVLPLVEEGARLLPGKRVIAKANTVQVKTVGLYSAVGMAANSTWS